MKARVTFIHDTGAGAADWDPAQQLIVTERFLSIKDLPSTAREAHITLSEAELPPEIIRDGLQHANSLHVRWQSPTLAAMPDPYASRLPAGLHVFFSPRTGKDSNTTNICPLLRRLFTSITKCDSPAKTFNSAPVLSPRFTSSDAQQYYQLVTDITSFAEYMQTKVCFKVARLGPQPAEACTNLATAIREADAVDIDYSVLTQTLVLRVLHGGSGKKDERGRAVAATESLTLLPLRGGRVEVGVLGLQDEAPGASTSASGDEDEAVKMGMGGLLTVLGEDSKASPVLFSFPSRHHASRTRYEVGFNAPTGLHPTMRITFPGGAPRPPRATAKEGRRRSRQKGAVTDGDELDIGRTCALHAQLALPSTIFPDKYQLSAPNFLAANNLRAIRSLTSPPPDLEAPDWAVDTWGSNMLMELAPPEPEDQAVSSASSSWHAEIPLHLRYLEPTPGGQQKIEVAWPAVFWACSSADGSKMGVNPFDREDLGYDGAFGPRTVFYHLTPARTGRLSHNQTFVESISVPVLDQNGLGFGLLRPVTAAVLLLGLVWVFWKLVYVTIANKGTVNLTKMAEKNKQDIRDGRGKEKAQ